jgi:undecaprenyl-diphosphatase
VGLLGELSRLDEAVYGAVAGQQTTWLDRPMRALSLVADKSVLWAGVAAVLAAAGGAQGRRAASRGMASVGVTSAICNLVLKPLSNRRRPRRDRHRVVQVRRVRMPGSSSFPSGHSASAFAFATAVGSDMPAAALPLHALAVLVAYSRVHTGVHYPGDVIAGALIGIAAGHVVPGVVDRVTAEDRSGLTLAGA